MEGRRMLETPIVVLTGAGISAESGVPRSAARAAYGENSGTEDLGDTPGLRPRPEAGLGVVCLAARDGLKV